MIKTTCKSSGWEAIEKGQTFLFEEKLYSFCGMENYKADTENDRIHGVVPHLRIDAFCLSNMCRSTIKITGEMGREMIVLVDVVNIDYELRG